MRFCAVRGADKVYIVFKGNIYSDTHKINLQELRV